MIGGLTRRHHLRKNFLKLQATNSRHKPKFSIDNIPVVRSTMRSSPPGHTYAFVINFMAQYHEG